MSGFTSRSKLLSRHADRAQHLVAVAILYRGETLAHMLFFEWLEGRTQKSQSRFNSHLRA